MAIIGRMNERNLAATLIGGLVAFLVQALLKALRFGKWIVGAGSGAAGA